jgi:hypothetical protein
MGRPRLATQRPYIQRAPSSNLGCPTTIPAKCKYACSACFSPRSSPGQACAPTPAIAVMATIAIMVLPKTVAEVLPTTVPTTAMAMPVIMGMPLIMGMPTITIMVMLKIVVVAPSFTPSNKTLPARASRICARG